jgi:hypothetical protein
LSTDGFNSTNAFQELVGVLNFHNHTDVKVETMPRVEHNLSLYLGFQKAKETNTDYLKVFKGKHIHKDGVGFPEIWASLK